MEDEPAERLAELPRETREFLSELTREDIATISDGLPIIRMIIGFGKVAKWLAITSLGLMVGTVMLWESVAKIISWFKQQ
ncbi:MAG: hypothetical protein E5Y67_12290 [Mesorhizobium sp.]|uniref:hypothetical protein n=1 Tax=Mesorhizobium sp. TaxID=1871066 RepID=UPI00122AB609|nr:hypothetical protein [Mesorhizobium sp.]TIM14452.1 MAG: hypothetical protein E5Y67_12290 [Mesorhizobium sp.]